MGWLDQLRGKTVAIDTAPLIYYFEDHAVFASLLHPFFCELQAGQVKGVTSVVSLIEVLVHPLRHGDERLASQYHDALLSHPHLATLPVNHAIAQLAAELRAEQNLKTPDAIQLATAMKANAHCLLTNDRNFGNAQGIEIITLRELAKSP